MILIKPENILWESRNDVIDYVGHGLPPRKKDFEKVIDALHGRNDINIPTDITIMDQDEFEDIVRRIYENNCRRRNRLIIIGAIAATIFIGAKIASHAKKKEQDEFDAAVDRYIIEHPGVTVEEI